MSGRAPGRLIGIARRPAHRAPMQTVETALIEAGGGVEGDHKGKKFPRRGVTSWRARHGRRRSPTSPRRATPTICRGPRAARTS
jgi:hypothetical protein